MNNYQLDRRLFNNVRTSSWASTLFTRFINGVIIWRTDTFGEKMVVRLSEPSTGRNGIVPEAKDIDTGVMM